MKQSVVLKNEKRDFFENYFFNVNFFKLKTIISFFGLSSSFFKTKRSFFKKVLRRIPKCSMASLKKWQFQFKKSKNKLCKHLKPIFQQNLLTNDLLSNLLESFLKLVQYVALLFNLKKCHICELIFNLRVYISQ